MAPGRIDPANDDFYDDEEEIDFSDLREQYEVRLEEGLDAFVVVDGLPVVPEENKPKLVKFLLRKLNTVGRTREDAIFMPMDEENMSQGFAFVEYETPEQALAATKQLHGLALDKRHTISVNKITDIERYGREGRIDDTFHAPHLEPFAEQEHLRSWLGDPQARDQFVMYRGENVGVFWNRKKDTPEIAVDRPHWTDSFVQWSPLGTYLTTMHPLGAQLWGGPGWKRIVKFPHTAVNLVDFSPNEKFLVTWSNKPLQVEEGDRDLTLDEDGKNYIIWEIATGKPLRSFQTIDQPGPQVDDKGQPVKRKIQWPAFKWSSDDKYVARLNPGQSISVYELPRMNLLDKTSVKIEGVADFEWAPVLPKRDGVKKYEQLLCYWTPEFGNQSAKVGLMSIPSKEIVRTRNLFNVTDCKLHWQSLATYICVKVDRRSKTGKSTQTNLEFFRVKEKNIPVDVVDTIKDTVINFAWEPRGDRFVLITTGEVPTSAAVPPKTSVSFYAPEKGKGTGAGTFKLIRNVDKKNSNAIYWSPKGRFVIVATIHSQQSFDLDFWDLDFEGEKKETEKDLAANLQLMNTAEHYGVTDVDWDPTGRYVATSASMWKHTMENGYHLWDFKGGALREEHIDRFKQFIWRPRPPTMLSKEEQKQIRKNLRDYSKAFDEEDQFELDIANKSVVEARKRLFDEWRAWRSRVEKELREERKSLGLPEDPNEVAEKELDGNEGTIIEEIVEEVIFEEEEIIG